MSPSTAPKSTWRSPLAILMGARRNDDAHLELMDEFHIQSSNHSTTQKKGSGTLWFWPFTQLPAAPTHADDVTLRRRNGHDNELMDNDRSRKNIPSCSPLVPPKAAFPPPVSGTSNRRRNSAKEDFLEEKDETDDLFQFSQSSFQHSGAENGNSYQPYENCRKEGNQHNGIEGRITWPDQKAIMGATFNFTNSIIGAGAMGLGGAFAESGGLISVVCLIGFAFLTKLSLDLVVDLSSDPDVINQIKGADTTCDINRGTEEDMIMLTSKSSSAGSNLMGRVSRSSARRRGQNGADGEILTEIGNYASSPENNQQAIDSDDNFSVAYSKNEIAVALEEDKSRNQFSSDTAHIDELPSPLMAHEVESDVNSRGEFSEPLHLTTRSNADADHPLASLSHESNVIDRYDSLTAALTQPRPFSPLNLDNGEITIADFDSSSKNEYRNKETYETNFTCTYEELGFIAFGSVGRISVLAAKALYSFGCLVAYVVVVRDNFGVALRRLLLNSSSNHTFNKEEEVSVMLFPQWAHHFKIGCDGRGNGSSFDASQCHSIIDDQHGDQTWNQLWLQDDKFLAFLISAVIMLPLSCLRSMEPLANFSFVSILSMMFLVMAVIFLYFTCTNPADIMTNEATFYDNWIKIRSASGFVESLGTFVFTFVCHHTVNLAYDSLPIPFKNPKIWRRVSTNSMVLATEASLAIGIFAYLTFGSQTTADILTGYPPDLNIANLARLLLCLTMVLTFPLPFLTCREMAILIILDAYKYFESQRFQRLVAVNPFSSGLEMLRRMLRRWLLLGSSAQVNVRSAEIGGEASMEEALFEMRHPPSSQARYLRSWDLTRPRFTFTYPWYGGPGQGWWGRTDKYFDQAIQEFLSDEEKDISIADSIGGANGEEVVPSPLSSPSSSKFGEQSPSSSSSFSYSSRNSFNPTLMSNPHWILLNGGGRQLAPPWHSLLTFAIWALATVCAIESPSLGDVLDFVGAFTGTLLAFILPALFSFKLKGFNHSSLVILGIGGIVGTVGTTFSFIKFFNDANSQ